MDASEVSSRLEIEHALHTIARGDDRQDLELMSSGFWPDATDLHHSSLGEMNAHEFVRGTMERNQDVTTVSQHRISNIFIEFDGTDDAYVESYYLAFHPHTEDGNEKLGIAAGRYLDRFQRRDGAWKILARQSITDWTRDHLDGSVWSDADGQSAQGLPKRLGDVSYAFFASKTSSENHR